ncbi:MAG TPA: maleylpyruvate isomerase family mycothiol-dependent enzyme [Actinomycetota bacterium]|nr:maleylpyruvate isomerase family mycothiol-dependent enzyme [Actinomycetota bacterium]
MADTAGVFEATKETLTEFVRSLPESDLARPVPATPDWTVQDVVAHLAGDVARVIVGDFPMAFFSAFGEDQAVGPLNDWTAGMVEERRGRSLDELLAEWDAGCVTLLAMMRGETPWPDNVPMFADRVLVTDLGVHLHDLYGAFGIQRDRDGAPVKLGLSGYIATIGWRLATDGVPALRIVADKEWVVGEGEPGATVGSSRWELFRAASGRRSVEQLRGFQWDGDPEPYIRYFYPYGIRTEALVE